MVTFVNTGEGWKVQSGTPVVFEVVCANVPEVPTFDELGEIFADGLVTVDCTNDEVDPAHADKTYGVLKGSYLFGDVTFDGTNYTVTMDVYTPSMPSSTASTLRSTTGSIPLTRLPSRSR